MFCHQYFLAGRYDLIQIIMKMTWLHMLFVLIFITCPSQIGQNGSAAAADDRLTDCIAQRRMLITEGWTADSDQKL